MSGGYDGPDIIAGMGPGKGKKGKKGDHYRKKRRKKGGGMDSGDGCACRAPEATLSGNGQSY